MSLLPGVHPLLCASGRYEMLSMQWSSAIMKSSGASRFGAEGVVLGSCPGTCGGWRLKARGTEMVPDKGWSRGYRLE